MRFVSISLFFLLFNAWSWADAPRQGGTVRILVQSSPLAGSQYYRLSEVHGNIQVGDPLELVREPGNPHDRNAIAVRWRGQALGYLPRKENRAVAKAIDEGETVRGAVEAITADPNPWKRLRISVFIEL